MRTHLESCRASASGVNPNAGKRKPATNVRSPRLALRAASETNGQGTTGVTVILADPATVRRALRRGTLGNLAAESDARSVTVARNVRSRRTLARMAHAR